MFHVEHSARRFAPRSGAGAQRPCGDPTALPARRRRLPRDRERLFACLTAAAAKLGGDVLDKPVRRRTAL
ncbi:MAG: hypothetical protein MR616_09115 [Pyramidobacter sp.]|nr:hypothetical protein [Pyramidobacter sp.]